MKTLRACFLALAATTFVLLASASTPFQSATLTFVQHDVNVAELDLLEVDADGHVIRTPATLNQSVPDNQAVLTGRKSRAELILNDGTIARVGQLSSFTYGKGTRLLQLKQGSALFVVPKGLGGTSVQAGAVTAAITGTTLLAQVFSDRVVIYVYEGSVEAAGLTINSGQFATFPNTGTPSLAGFNVARGIETAALFNKFIAAKSHEEVMRQIGAILNREGAGPQPPATDLGDKTIVNPRLNTPPPREPNRDVESPGDYYNESAG